VHHWRAVSEIEHRDQATVGHAGADYTRPVERNRSQRSRPALPRAKGMHRTSRPHAPFEPSARHDRLPTLATEERDLQAAACRLFRGIEDKRKCLAPLAGALRAPALRRQAPREFGRHLANALTYFPPRKVAVLPKGDRLAIIRQGLELAYR
jgi:hypothetical protein